MLNENGTPIAYGSRPEDYLTDVLARHATATIRRGAEAGEPFFLYIAPTAWSYSGGADRPMESVIRSSQQRLANGNTLFDESDGGRLVEVVWEFVNPVRGGEGNHLVPVVMLGERRPLDWFEPAFRATLRPSS